MPAELPLVPSAIALAISALLFFHPRSRRTTHRIATLFIAIAAVLPIVLLPLVDPARAAGRALWEWSAAGGPSVRAAYRVDPLAAVAAALTFAYGGAVLAQAAHIERRHPALAALTIALAFVTVAVVVTDDLLAAVVVIAVTAILTALALFAAAPVGATARAAAYLSLGVQAWVLGALLIALQGSPTLALSHVAPDAITSGAIVAATIGALLFAGLYPVVAWSAVPDDAGSDPGRIGGLLTMPAGISATLLLLRVVAASGLGPSAIVLPEVVVELRLVLAIVVLAGVTFALLRSPRGLRRAIVTGALLLVALVLYPFIGWGALVLFAASLTIAYAAVVSLSIPEQWETVRSDLALVAVWIGIATASPLGLAGGLVALYARATAAIVSALGLVPHREYIAFVASSALFLVGAIACAAGALASDDPTLVALGVFASLLLIVLEAVQLGRRYRSVVVPRDLDLASAAVAALACAGAALALAPLATLVSALQSGNVETGVIELSAIGGAAALIAVLARVVRPALPYFEAVAERSGPAMRGLDPAPIAIGAFRIIEGIASGGSVAFGTLERNAGVWVAAALIVALLLWAAR